MDKSKLILPISILLGCIILGGFYYVSETNKQKLIEKPQLLQREMDDTFIETEKKEEENSSKTKIISQLDYFDSTFENLLVNAHMKCGWLAEHNNAILRNDIEMLREFPDTLETDTDNCRSKLAEVILFRKELVAEPELVNLRKKISEFVEITINLATYALEGGGQAEIMNNYEEDLRKLRTEIREEIIIARRQYNQ